MADRSRSPTPPRPLDAAALDALALAYVARFATSAGRLRDYCRRKLAERGWRGDAAADIEGLVARFAAAGYVDDAAFAVARAAGLRRRGYGERRIAEVLRGAGIGDADRAAARGGGAAARRAALALARKRRFGPFDPACAGPGEPDQARRQKQLAAMLRAGHALDTARELLDAADEAAALAWVEEAGECFE